MTAAYAPFVNGGYRIKPRLIARVETIDGQILYSAPVQHVAAIDPGVAFVLGEMLRSVVDAGTGRRARVSGLPPELALLGKTGTTNGSADVWFIGGSADAVVTTWLGFDRPRPILANATGGRLAAPVAGRVFRELYRNRPPPPPGAPPVSVAMREVDTESGKLATSACPREKVVREWLLASPVPLEECQLHKPGLSNFFQRIFGAVFGK
jgi:penicillin-binding protein 1A